MAQRHGARDDRQIPRILSAYAFILGGIFLVISIPGHFFAGELLELLDTTEDMLPLSTQYLSIIFLGLPFLAVYNVYSAALRALGDSRAPFLAVVVSSVVNIALDILLVAVIPWGVRGAAIATIFSQAAMTIFIIGYAIKKHPALRFKPGRGMSDLSCVAEGVRFGLPPMIQSSLTATGKPAAAELHEQLWLRHRDGHNYGLPRGHDNTSAYHEPQLWHLDPLSAEPRRARRREGGPDTGRGHGHDDRGVADAHGHNYPDGGWLIAMFGAGETVVNIGRSFFMGIAPFYVVCGLAMALRGYLEGLGDMTFSSAIGICALATRIAASYAMRPFFGNMTVAYAEAVSWALMLALYAARCAVKRRAIARG